MKHRSDITGVCYEDSDCVFFRNPKQSAFYMFNGIRLIDIFVSNDADDGLKFVYVFLKSDHNKLKHKWRNRVHD